MIKYFYDLEQGGDEWLELRRGIPTASEMKNIITPKTLKYSESEKSDTHLYELLAQRISGFVEPHYISDDMLRGKVDEIEARNLYAKNYGEVKECGFITNDKFGYVLGYSPDGLVDNNGAIECKSRIQQKQIKVLESGTIPDADAMQCQVGIMVAELDFVDYVSYCAGLPMIVIRIEPDKEKQKLILKACDEFHARITIAKANYENRLNSGGFRMIPTERKILQEII